MSSTLAPPETSTNGRSTSPSSLPELLQLALEQQARVGRQQLGDADCRGVRAMNRAEGVLDEQLVVVCQPPRELGVVGRLARVEARVLEHVEPLVGQQLPQPPGDGRHREGGVGPLRPAEVRADRDLLRVVLEQVLERRQRGADARVVGDAAVLERHVQVAAHEHALAGDVGLADGARLTHSLRPAASRRPSPPGRRAGTSSPTRCRTSRRP